MSPSGFVSPPISQCVQIYWVPSVYEEVLTITPLTSDASSTVPGTSALGPGLFFGELTPYLILGPVFQTGGINSYFYATGSSVAAAVVAGAVALLWSARPDLVGNVVETRRALEAASDPKPSGKCNNGVVQHPNNEFGYGNLNVGAAFDRRTNVTSCFEEYVQKKCTGCLPTTDECAEDVATKHCTLPGCTFQRDAYLQMLAQSLNTTSSC